MGKTMLVVVMALLGASSIQANAAQDRKKPKGGKVADKVGATARDTKEQVLAKARQYVKERAPRSAEGSEEASHEATVKIVEQIILRLQSAQERNEKVVKQIEKLEGTKAEKAQLNVTYNYERLNNAVTKFYEIAPNWDKLRARLTRENKTMWDLIHTMHVALFHTEAAAQALFELGEELKEPDTMDSALAEYDDYMVLGCLQLNLVEELMGRRWGTWNDKLKDNWVSQYVKMFDRFYIDEDADDDPEFEMIQDGD